MAFHWNIIPNDKFIGRGKIQIATAVKFIDFDRYIKSNAPVIKGWVGIGFSETGGMRGADVVYFTFTITNTSNNNNTTTDTGGTTTKKPIITAKLVDAYILDSLAKPIPDPIIHQDWTLNDSIITDDGYAIFEMERSLLSADTVYDRPFVDDSSVFVQDHKLIGAWGLSRTHEMSYHGRSRIHTSIQLFQPRQSDKDGEDGNDVIDQTSEPGLFYDQFQREMETRSDGSIDMNIQSYGIKLLRTEYYEECHSPFTTTLNDDVFVIGYEFFIQQSSKKYLHHIVVYGHHDHNCSEDSFSRSVFIGWTPGDEYLYFPANTGMKIGASSFQSFTMQYHFDNSDLDVGKVDTGSGVRLYYTTQEVKDEIGMVQIGDPLLGLYGMPIGQGFTRHTFACPSSCTDNRFETSSSITIVKEQLHMHSFGKRMVNQVMRNGSVVHESSIDYWDFDQIGTAAPQNEPFEMKKGDSFRSICYYNSNENTIFGAESHNEMCMAFILYFPKQPSFRTCSVRNRDTKCVTKYQGRYDLRTQSELGRKFGNRFYSDMECIDSMTYTFGKYELEGKTMMKDCEWLRSRNDDGDDAGLSNKMEHCDYVVEGHRVSDKCPRACLTCVGPPTSVPSAIPTQPPTNAPSTTPSDFPSLEPSEEPSNLPSTSPSKVHSAEPSNIHSLSPTISLIPTSLPTTSPSTSLSPSSFSSEQPSTSPTARPTSAPTYPEQSFELYIVMEFDSLVEFKGKDKNTFEEKMDALVKSLLDENGDDFSVVSRINRFERIEKSRSRRNHRGRRLQEIPSGLKVISDVYVDVRAETQYTAGELSQTILAAFNKEQVRENFIYSLQTSESTKTFSSISIMTMISINKEEMEFSSVNNNGGIGMSNSMLYAIVGGGIGAIVAILLGFLFFIQRRAKSNNSSSKFTGSQTRLPSPQNDPRIAYTIEVNQDVGEISTIGDPLGTGFTGMQMQIMHQQQNDEAMLQQIAAPSQHYDYQRVYGGMGDSSQSLSTSTDNQSSSQQLYDSNDEKIVVVAPSGSLGVVIGNPTGCPAVHAIKETSPILEFIQIGDKLISVDGVDTTAMSAIRVSSLIGSKAMNPQRILVFARPTERH